MLSFELLSDQVTHSFLLPSFRLGLFYKLKPSLLKDYFSGAGRPDMPMRLSLTMTGRDDLPMRLSLTMTGRDDLPH
jgi:hypothetical protein